jgi:hypothetical protein
MRVVSGSELQEPWIFIYSHVINSTLHWEKEVVIEVGYVYGLVYHQVIHLTGLGVYVQYSASNGFVRLQTKGRVISLDCYRSIKV